jgi:hypothetical protein
MLVQTQQTFGSELRSAPGLCISILRHISGDSKGGAGGSSSSPGDGGAAGGSGRAKRRRVDIEVDADEDRRGA